MSRKAKYLQKIDACNQFELSRFVDFSIDDVIYGRLLPAFVGLLQRWPDVFDVSTEGVCLHSSLTGYRQRTEAVAEVVAHLAEEGVITGWRDENYPVAIDAAQPPVFEIERAAAPHFGFRAWGVHVNGLVRVGKQVKVWVGQRAADKPTFPGMLDHLAAGGQPAGISRMDNVIKECGEEAGVPPALARQAKFVRELHYCCETRTGLKPDTIGIYDLYLPEGFVPQNTDGEVAAFFLWSFDEVADAVANSERFKPNCNLVLIDLLLRHGKSGLDRAAEVAVVSRLYAPLALTRLR